MRIDHRALLMLPCLLGVAAIAGCGGDDPGGGAVAAARPAARPAVSAPVELELAPSHRSGVAGTAVLTPTGKVLKVTVTLDKRLAGPLMAHIHWGPCRKEPTATNPRIWASLNDLMNSRSRTTVDVVTLKELQSEPASINVHDPDHANRPLACGDIPARGLTQPR